MKVHLLTGLETSEQLSVCLKQIDVFLLPEGESIIDFFDKSTQLSPGSLIKMRIANDLKLSYKVVMRTNGKEEPVFSFQQVLEKIEIDVDFEVIIDDIQGKCTNLLAEIIQRFLYLKIKPCVRLRSEELQLKRAEWFRKEAEFIIDKLGATCIEVDTIDCKDEAEKIRSEIKNKFIEIINNIREVIDRPLRIAVLATRNTGKSTIVNSFLGECYAPTSLTLPTPNTIIYKKSLRDKIELDYKNEIREFNTADQLRAFIYNEFIEAQKQTAGGASLEDMTVYYGENDNCFANFEIIDTPGPNLAGTEHAKIAYQWLAKADVVIFVIDYTKHLTDDEIKFLNETKSVFKRANKNYSLIIAANKIDEIFAAEEQIKSEVRGVEVIRERLQKLDEIYANSFLAPTSARSYFEPQYLMRITNNEINQFTSYETLCNKKKQQNKQMAELDEAHAKEDGIRVDFSRVTMLSNVRTMLDHFDTYELNDSINKLLEFSGMPQLISLVKYIAEQKAGTEQVNNLLYSINRDLSDIKNMFSIEKIENIRPHQAKICKLITEVKIQIADLEKKAADDKAIVDFKKEVIAFMKYDKENTKNNIDNEFESQFESIRKSIKYDGNKVDLSDIGLSKAYSIQPNISNFDEAQRSVNIKYSEVVTRLTLVCNRHAEELKVKVMQFTANLYRDYGTDLNISWPDLPPCLPQIGIPNISPFDFSLDDIANKAEAKERGIIGWIVKVITLGNVDKYEGDTYIDAGKFNMYLQKLQDDAIGKYKLSIDQFYNDLEESAINSGENLEKDYKIQYEKTTNSAGNVFRSIEEGLKMDKFEYERLVKNLQDIRTIIQPLIDIMEKAGV